VIKGGKQHIIKKLRVNEGITAREVRVVGDKGEQLGIMPIAQARELARKQDLDLLEVAPTSVPPVCRLVDYGKFKYEQQKKEREIRKSQKLVDLREVRLRPKIGEHDLESKLTSIKKWLVDGDKVKITMMFRGREITHQDLGWGILKRIVDNLKGLALIEKQPSMEGQRMFIVIAPVSAQQTKPKEEVKETEDAKVKNA
jgi:translation initiation factor IF-3